MLGEVVSVSQSIEAKNLREHLQNREYVRRAMKNSTRRRRMGMGGKDRGSKR